MDSAIILFAHGSRDPKWREPIETIASSILSRAPERLVRCAYLELCAPTLPQAAAELVSRGAHRLKVFPLFLGVGKHAREDIPALLDEIRTAHPGIDIDLLPTIGESPQLIALIADLALF
ncbi:MAG: CbiX/SirB N-terminal domain-containing protein [Pseudomonadota bacterium]